MDPQLLNNLEISGGTAAFLMCFALVAKLLYHKSCGSRCGMFTLDLKSPKTKRLEAEYNHIFQMQQLHVQLEQIALEKLKYQQNYEVVDEQPTDVPAPLT